ncbi:MAG: 50S ribosomal protein L15 [Myxococcota bacterium]|nr:50S ribosomal protein L15 [Myxococcota bacterium]
MANELSNLKPSPGSTKARKRVGRGEGSGKGKTAGRGTKGQGARNTIHPRFEGGQMPLQRRLPKRGFNNIFAKQYTEVGIDRISAKFSKGDTVDAEALKAAGVISKIAKNGIKVLGNGEIDKALTIKAAKFTKSAAEKISAAGGTVEVI